MQKTKTTCPQCYAKRCRRENKNGFSIIEALVTLFIFSLITVTFYQIFTLGTSYIIEAKNRSAAISLANEKMEIIRNLNYDEIGTVGGIPGGSLDDDEYVSSGGRNFHVKTDILYVDDSLDGIGGSDTVNTTADYKTAKVTILWGSEKDSNQVEFISRFVPQGREVGNPDEGTLVVNVSSDENGVPTPLSGVSVNIKNSFLSPSVNKNTETNNSGQASLPGAKEAVQTYQLTVSKNGYETVVTTDPDDPGLPVGFIPFDMNGSVFRGGNPSISNIKINKLVSSLKIFSVSGLGESIPDAKFSLIGGRQLNIDTGNGEKYFNFNELNLSTGTSGEKIFSEADKISPGSFYFSLKEELSDYTFIKTEPASPFIIEPAGSRELKIIFADKNRDSLWVKIVDATANQIVGAKVKLKNSTGYESEQTTLADGIAFFSNADGLLLAGDYEVEISADGFTTKTENTSINKLTKLGDIILTAL